MVFFVYLFLMLVLHSSCEACPSYIYTYSHLGVYIYISRLPQVEMHICLCPKEREREREPKSERGADKDAAVLLSLRALFADVAEETKNKRIGEAEQTQLSPRKQRLGRQQWGP
jgi:hypothetical protein